MNGADQRRAPRERARAKKRQTSGVHCKTNPGLGACSRFRWLFTRTAGLGHVLGFATIRGVSARAEGPHGGASYVQMFLIMNPLTVARLHAPRAHTGCIVRALRSRRAHEIELAAVLR